PLDGCDAAVRLLRRGVTHRQLRDHRAVFWHLRPDGRARRSPRRGGDRAHSCRRRTAGASVNRPIRRVGYAVTVLILLLVAQLTYLQVVDANNLANNPKNVRKQLKDYNRARGEILTADGQIVARSVPTDGDFKYMRQYPQ